MFLQPQHFQQQDGYHEARLRHYLHWLAPFAWGIKSLSSVRPRCRTTCVTLSGVNWSPGRGRLCVFRGTLSPAMRRFDRVLLRTCWILVAAPWGDLGLKRLHWEERHVSKPEWHAPRGEGCGGAACRQRKYWTSWPRKANVARCTTSSTGPVRYLAQLSRGDGPRGQGS